MSRNSLSFPTIVLYNLPKVGLSVQNIGKTALIYSVVTMYLGLRPTIKGLKNLQTKSIFTTRLQT